MLGLYSSPLVLCLSFTFMTDIPYLSCLVLALYLYTRAIRTGSYGMAFGASLAAAGAILTRQFGVILPGAMILVWMLTKDRGRKAGLFALGLGMPLAAVGWQLWAYQEETTWATRANLYHLGQFYADPQELLKSLLWRPAVMVHYVALFALPFVLVPGAMLWNRWKGEHGRRRWRKPAIILCYLIGILVLYSPLTVADPPVFPLIPGLQPEQGGRLTHILFSLGLTLATAAGGALAVDCFLARYQKGSVELPAHERLLDFVAAGAALTALGFWWIADKHLIVFLPYALIVIGREHAALLRRHRPALATACIVIALLSAAYARKWVTQNEAYWEGAQIARRQATEQQVISSSWEWDGYYHFEDFLSQHRSNRNLWVFDHWLTERQAKADYLIVPQPPTNASWQVIVTVPYEPYPFVTKRAYVMKRLP